MPAATGVLITRPAADSARLATLITQRGFSPVIAPLLRITPRPTTLPQAVQALLVTSGNALDSIIPWPIPVLAVGDSTAARARAAGFTHVTSASGDAAALAVLAARTLHPAGGPLLLLSGAGQGFAAAAALRAAGFRVLRRVTYAACPTTSFPAEAARALTAGTLHAAVFLSGETATTFARLLPAACMPCLHTVLGLAIGKPAADALKPLPWRQVRLARSPNLDEVLALL